ncbi:LysM peptidoglycan-binding domain-containing protein [Ferrimonas marina]|uniref:Uncharacterized protein n=1 Tax=Ferrimonas marina TaxID=299255 RepID=A0A1M5Y0C1_9GAMM|nr:hypothetical protein [Ferrimonas marina]SHI05442.1 hypothetical protein SAMN02745129_3861 [Ferrimonas marina]
MRAWALCLALLCGSAQAVSIEQFQVDRLSRDAQGQTQIWLTTEVSQNTARRLRYFLVQDGQLESLSGEVTGPGQLVLHSAAQAKPGAELWISAQLNREPDAVGRLPLPAPLASIAPLAQTDLLSAPTPIQSEPTPDCNLLPEETLWRASERLAPQFHLGRFGMIWALYEANPARFTGSVHRLKGRTLRCPGPVLQARWQDESQAQQEFEAVATR